MSTQITATELQKKITGYLETLAIEADIARKSEQMTKYLDFVAKFHHYSPSNVFLIMLARPDATHVAGYEAWRKLGRYVKKNEHGIAILAPMVHKEDPDDDNSPKILTGFKVVYVFDVSQTDGQPLPPVPDWKSPEKNEELNRRLIKFAESRGISVTFKDLPGETQGVSRGGAIEIDSSAGTKTLIHELAHEMMHHKRDVNKSHSQIEIEAECVAFSVAKYYGIGFLNCPNYLAFYGSTPKKMIEAIEIIHKYTVEIICGL